MGAMEAALAEPHRLDSARDAALRVIANVRLAVSGEAAVVERAVVALLAEGHVLVEDVPGVGKTTLARALARSLDCSFARIQLTPDVLPSDVTGVSVFDQRTSEFAFRPGPGVREHRARRRAQPRLAAHAVGAARVHAGAPGHRRRRGAAAGRAVLRDRDAEPDRAGRHVPAAGGAARPLRAAARARLSGAGRGGAHAGRPDGAGGLAARDAGGRRGCGRADRRRARLPQRPRRAGAARLRRRALRGDARGRPPGARREPARGRDARAARARPRAHPAGATTCCPTTSRSWRPTRSPIGCCPRPARPRTSPRSSRSCSRGCPSRCERQRARR